MFILREHLVKMSELVTHFNKDESYSAKWKKLENIAWYHLKFLSGQKQFYILFRNTYTCGKHIKKCMGMTIITFRRVVINL